jgi:hypothetical protein
MHASFCIEDIAHPRLCICIIPMTRGVILVYIVSNDIMIDVVKWDWQLRTTTNIHPSTYLGSDNHEV